MKLTKVISRNALSGGHNGRWGITLLIALLMMAAQTAWAASTRQFPTTSGGSGTSGDPYKITSIADLNKLAEDVNSGTGYGNTYFRLENDLTFSHSKDWDAETSDESNFTSIGTAVGTTIYSFQGYFDGNNKTISGLRINSNSGYQGLFGSIYATAEVKNVTIADARITGNSYTGGIVGINGGGKVTNCHVMANVAIVASGIGYGGVVGCNNGTVSCCSSAVTISVASGKNPSYLGGLVGWNYSSSSDATLTDNFVIGAVIPTGQKNTHAAIAVDSKTNGYNVLYQRNYYYNCTVAGIDTDNGKGITTYNSSSSTTTGDISDNDGAVCKPAYSLTVAPGITVTSTPASAFNGISYYCLEGAAVTLSGPPTEPGYFYSYYLNGTLSFFNTFTMPASDFNVTLGEVVHDWDTGSNGSSEATAYQIKTTTDLDLLAQRVNSGNDYKGKFFKLMNDIAYTHTTAWNDATSTENNYTAIGNNAKYFGGTFDGNNKTISGIRIYKGGSNASSDSFQGLFGHVGGSGTVQKLTLADARITGYINVGGIAGNNGKGTITYCCVAADVALHAVQSGGGQFGGIAGYNSIGTVSNCTSGVKITARSGITGIRYLGGVVGYNAYHDSKGTITGCHAIGACIPVNGENAGAIVGYYYNDTSDNPLNNSNNTYHSCLVGTNAFNIGVGNYIKYDPSDVFNGDRGNGASLDNTKFYLDDYMDASTLIAAYADPANHTANSGTAPSVSSLTATLNRTFPKDKKQTICLPFPPTALLSLGTVWEFTGISGGKAVMTQRTSGLTANTPYIFEATANVTSLTFSDVSVSYNADPKTENNTDNFTFHGTYAEKTWEANDPAVTSGHLYGFMMKDNDENHQEGQFVKARRKTILRPFSCYLEYNGELDGTQARTATRADEGELPEVIDIVWVSANSEETGISEMEKMRDAGNEAWYSLDGRRLLGEPTAKGIYIKNGKKVAIK